MVGIDLAEHQIGIGHGRFDTTAAIAGGARRRAGAVGADGDALQLVDAGNRAATGAYLDHLDDGNAHRKPGTLHVAIGAGDLEFAGARRARRR